MGVATCWIGPGADHKSVVAKMGNRFDEARLLPDGFFWGGDKKNPGKKSGGNFGCFRFVFFLVDFCWIVLRCYSTQAC